MNQLHKTKLLTPEAYMLWYLSDPVRKEDYMTSDLCRDEVDRFCKTLQLKN